MGKKVLVTEYIHPAGLELLSRECEVVQPADISIEELMRAVTEVDGLLVRVAPISREVIGAASKLKVIGKHGVGTDNIDVPAATERGIPVCNTPEANSEAVATLALTLMLTLSRRLLECDSFVREGRWAGKDNMIGSEPYGRTLGILGVGRIGGRLADMCRAAFGMKVYAYDPYVTVEAMEARGISRTESLDGLLSVADYVSVHTPLTAATKGILGAEQFDRMKRTAFLINTSRGPVVEEAALIQALRQGKIAGAGLDVLEQEPPAADNPLLSMKNVVLLPHMGAATHESMEKMATHAATNVLMVLRGERSRWVVNRGGL